jgi:hypothetical protein
MAVLEEIVGEGVGRGQRSELGRLGRGLRRNCIEVILYARTSPPSQTEASCCYVGEVARLRIIERQRRPQRSEGKTEA